MTHQESIDTIHAVYVACTGLAVTLTMPRIYAYEAFMAHGFTADDLRMAVTNIKRKIKSGQKTMAALKFSNLVDRTEWMEEELAEFKALSRIHKPHPASHLTERAKAVTAPKQGEAKPIADVIKGMAAFREFQAMKEQL